MELTPFVLKISERGWFTAASNVCRKGVHMSTKSGFRLGRYDSRDYIYLARKSPENSAAAGRIIIEHDVPVVDQGNIVPCCVSVAVTTCLEVLDQNEDIPLSFMYNYYWARTSRRSLGVLDIRQGLDAAASYGICIKAFHDVQLDREGATTKPNQAAYKEAMKRRIAFDPAISSWSYEHFTNSNRIIGWRNAIQQGAPVIIGFDLTDAYKNIPYNGNTHILPVNDVAFDGHAVTVMGYDDGYDNGSLGSGAFFVRDSRGSVLPKKATGGCLMNWFKHI